MKFLSHSRVHPDAKRLSGFSLIEVLAAMLILTVGATSLLALFASASSTHKRAVDRTHTALVAEQVLAEVQARYRPGMRLRDLLEGLESDLPERIDGYYWEVVLHRPGEGDREESSGQWTEDELVVRLAIKWSSAARAREEVYTTIILPRLHASR